jgi:hypothetical protein
LKEIKKDTTHKKAQELAENAEEAYKYKMALNKINQGGKAATVANVLLELQKLQTDNDSDESDKEAEVNVFKKGNYQQNSNKFNKHNNGNNSNQNNNSNKQNNSNKNNGNNENSNSQKPNNTKPHRNLECQCCGKKGHIARNESEEGRNRQKVRSDISVLLQLVNKFSDPDLLSTTIKEFF